MQLIAMFRHGTCVDSRRRFDGLCDGELPSDVEDRARRHIAGCRWCRRALGRLEATVGDLARLGARPSPSIDSVRDQVADRIVCGGPDESKERMTR